MTLSELASITRTCINKTYSMVVASKIYIAIDQKSKLSIAKKAKRYMYVEKQNRGEKQKPV